MARKVPNHHSAYPDSHQEGRIRMDINLMMSIFLLRVSLSPGIKRSWIQTNEEERGNLKLSNFVPWVPLIRDAEVFT